MRLYEKALPEVILYGHRCGERSPLGTASTSVSEYVAEAERVLERYPDLEYRLEPMFTTIQGDLNRIFAAVADMHEAVAAMGAVRISTVIKIDDRRDSDAPMDEKIAVVQRLLDEGDTRRDG